MEGSGNSEENYSAEIPDMTPEWAPITDRLPLSHSGTVIKQEVQPNSPILVWDDATATAKAVVTTRKKRGRECVEDEHDFNDGVRTETPKKKAKFGHSGYNLPQCMRGVSMSRGVFAPLPTNGDMNAVQHRGTNADNVSNGTLAQHIPNRMPAPTRKASASMGKVRVPRYSTPEPPSLSPITPPPSAMLTKAQIQRTQWVALQQILIERFGVKEALLILDEWYQSGSMGSVLQVENWLPGLRELGLDILYEPGQMDWWLWRDMCFPWEKDSDVDAEHSESDDDCQEQYGAESEDRDGGEEEEKEEEREGSKEAELQDRASAWTASGPRDFWSVVL